MKFPLSLDLRRVTLAENPGPGVHVMDADKVRVMTVYPDAAGRYDRASAIVDTLNRLEVIAAFQRFL